MTAEPATSTADSNTCSEPWVSPEAPTRLVTVIVGIVVALTFLFGFGNVLALGLLLRVLPAGGSRIATGWGSFGRHRRRRFSPTIGGAGTKLGCPNGRGDDGGNWHVCDGSEPITTRGTP